MRALLAVGCLFILACGGQGQDLEKGFPRTTFHEAVDAGVLQYAFTYRAADESPQPTRPGMWAGKLNYYGNPMDGNVMRGAVNRTVAVNEGDTWDLGELVFELVMDISVRTIDGFDPMERVAFTLVAISDTSGGYGPGDTNDLIQETIRDDDDNPIKVSRWKVQSAEDEVAPETPVWMGGQLIPEQLCPEAQRIAQGESVVGWCAFECELYSLDEQYQLGQYSLCEPP